MLVVHVVWKNYGLINEKFHKIYDRCLVYFIRGYLYCPHAVLLGSRTVYDHFVVMHLSKKFKKKKKGVRHRQFRLKPSLLNFLREMLSLLYYTILYYIMFLSRAFLRFSDPTKSCSLFIEEYRTFLLTLPFQGDSRKLGHKGARSCANHSQNWHSWSNWECLPRGLKSPGFAL